MRLQAEDSKFPSNKEWGSEAAGRDKVGTPSMQGFPLVMNYEDELFSDELAAKRPVRSLKSSFLSVINNNLILNLDY